MALQAKPFPIDQPIMPEERQIGRRSAIEGLETRILASGHQWLIGPRRIGKTSVAKAVLVRLRRHGLPALDVDLSKLPIDDVESLAGEIARQAQAAQVGSATRIDELRELAKRQPRAARKLGKALTELGYQDEGEALAAVSAVLAGADDGTPGLGEVLEALALDARANGRPIAVLLDEVHLLEGLDGAERDVASWCREPDFPILFLLAGSEESAVEALRQDGEPLAGIGQEYELPDIAPEDWIVGLRERFAEAGVGVEPAALESILDASGGHPRRTMLVCSYVLATALAQVESVVADGAVELGIRNAREDRTWS
jgi:hypothetical protein